MSRGQFVAMYLVCISIFGVLREWPEWLIILISVASGVTYLIEAITMKEADDD